MLRRGLLKDEMVVIPQDGVRREKDLPGTVPQEVPAAGMCLEGLLLQPEAFQTQAPQKPLKRISVWKVISRIGWDHFRTDSFQHCYKI